MRTTSCLECMTEIKRTILDVIQQKHCHKTPPIMTRKLSCGENFYALNDQLSFIL